MKYHKVFSSSRFHTKSQNTLSVDSKLKRVVVGSRSKQPEKVAFIGKVVEQGRATNVLDYGIFCDVTFPHVIGIFGSRGSGKSFDLGVFLEGIFLGENLDGVSKTGDSAVVFDVQDQFWTLSHQPSQTIKSDVPQIEELIKWGLSARALPSVRVLVPNGSDTQVPGAVPFSLAPDQLSPSDWLAILELERFSAMGQALLTLLNASNPRPPALLAQDCVTSGVLANFQQGTVDALRWRLESLADAAIIGDQGILIDELLRPGVISVVLMRNLPDAVRGLVVGVIARLVADRMGRIQQSRKVAARVGGSALPDAQDVTSRLWMLLDEAHVLAPSDGSTAASSPLIDYVKRGRDAGLSLVFATQQPSAVNSKLMSQADMSITHMLGTEADLSAAIARMPTRTEFEFEIDNERVTSMSEVVRSLNPGEAVIADGASSRAFVAKIRPRVTAHGGVTPS